MVRGTKVPFSWRDLRCFVGSYARPELPRRDADRLRQCLARCGPTPRGRLELIEQSGLSAQVHDRGGEREVRFDRQSEPALLPVWWSGKLQVVRWGKRDHCERKLTPTGWGWR